MITRIGGGQFSAIHRHRESCPPGWCSRNFTPPAVRRGPVNGISSGSWGQEASFPFCPAFLNFHRGGKREKSLAPNGKQPRLTNGVKAGRDMEKGSMFPYGLNRDLSPQRILENVLSSFIIRRWSNAGNSFYDVEGSSGISQARHNYHLQTRGEKRFTGPQGRWEVAIHQDRG